MSCCFNNASAAAALMCIHASTAALAATQERHLTMLLLLLLLLLLRAGAKTQLAGFVTSMVVMFVLLFLTKVFELLPYNTMAAIIISGVMGLIEFDTAIYLMKVRAGAGVRALI
jgi:hypothetical protein